MSDLYNLVNDELREKCRSLEDAKSLYTLLREHISLYLQPPYMYYPGCRFDNEIRGLLFIFKECATKPDFDRSAMSEVVAYIIIFCYGWNIDESELVSESLQDMYTVEGHFNFIFMFYLWDPFVYNCNSEWPEDFKNPRHQVAYFAHHACKTKALFGGVPFVDVPVIINEQHRISPLWYNGMTGDSSEVITLLQHGASLVPPTDSPQRVAEFVMKVIDQAAAEFKEISVDDEIIVNDISKLPRLYKILSNLECADIVLKAFSPLKLSHLRIGFFRNLSPYFDNELDFVKMMSDERFVPMLKYSFEEPRSLKHLSRIVVRETLQRNRELPFGIYTLDLPQKVKQFLDLDDI